MHSSLTEWTRRGENRRSLPAKRPEPVGQVVAILPRTADQCESLTRGLSRELAENYRLSVLLAEFSNHGFPLLGTRLNRRSARQPHLGAFLRNSGGAFDTLEARDATPQHSALLECARDAMPHLRRPFRSSRVGCAGGARQLRFDFSRREFRSAFSRNGAASGGMAPLFGPRGTGGVAVEEGSRGLNGADAEI